jgi:hypothetical protein
MRSESHPAFSLESNPNEVLRPITRSSDVPGYSVVLHFRSLTFATIFILQSRNLSNHVPSSISFSAASISKKPAGPFRLGGAFILFQRTLNLSGAIQWDCQAGRLDSQERFSMPIERVGVIGAANITPDSAETKYETFYAERADQALVRCASR